MTIEEVLATRDSLAMQAFNQGERVEKTYRTRSGHQIDLIGEKVSENYDGPYVTCHIFEDGDPVYYLKMLDVTEYGRSVQNGEIRHGHPDTSGRIQVYTVGKFRREEYAVAYMTTKYHNDPLQPSARAVDPEPFRNYGEWDIMWESKKWEEQFEREEAEVREKE